MWILKVMRVSDFEFKSINKSFDQKYVLKTFGEIKIEKPKRNSNLWLTDPYVTILQIVLCCYVTILGRKKCKIMIDFIVYFDRKYVTTC